MAAFSALNIDNAIVKINSPELPALDGSSYEYVKKFSIAGIKEQNKNKKFFKIIKKVEVKNGDRFISIFHLDKLSINISINYPNTIIGHSQYFISIQKIILLKIYQWLEHILFLKILKK